MQIQLKCNCSNAECPEWAIIELQGIVEPQSGFENHLPNLEIGRLCHSSAQENYTFTVGYHELTGTKVTLKKPMLVLKKKKPLDKNNSSSDTLNTELEVIGIIRHKILFRTRPKALISGSHPRDKKG